MWHFYALLTGSITVLTSILNTNKYNSDQLIHLSYLCIYFAYT